MNANLTSPGDRSTPKSRHAMLQFQQQQFRRLLNYIWNRSAFYRDYYTSNGINERHLADVSISDLPLLPKKTLIDNFDRAVLDPRLKRAQIEEWFESHRDPAETYCKDIVAIHGSGTTGDIGIFACDRKGWAIADAMMVGRLPQPENFPKGKTKFAFYGSALGHFAAVSGAVSLPKSVYDTLILSLLDSPEQTVKHLNTFQPHRLGGYSSAVANLAELACKGQLQIRPQSVFVGSDKLTEGMAKIIRQAWGVPIYDLYGASESKYIAIRTPEHDQMMVMDDLNIVEVLDENDRAVHAEQDGRVVLTNLLNYTLPILRYELGDYVVRGTEHPDSPFTTLREVRGRVNDALPIVLANGQRDSIHPIVLSTFHVPTVERLQFVSVSPERVRIDYVAPRNVDPAVQHEFQQMLDMKGARRTTVAVRRVPAIANDAKTGKLRLVNFAGQEVEQRSGAAHGDVPVIALKPVHVESGSSFVPFGEAEGYSRISSNRTTDDASIRPVSYAQQSLWFLDRLLPLRAVYNMAKFVRLVGALDVAALRGALNELVRRHAALRTTFAVDNGAPVQVIASALELALEAEDLRGLPEAGRQAEAQRRVQAEAQAPFDLARGPLLRARLLRLGETEQWLLVTLHHIVTDGWSMGVLWRELSTIYGAYTRGEASPLPELPAQYADYAVWQREWLPGAVLAEQLGYWKEAMAGLPVLELPTDRPRPPVASYRGGRVEFALGADLTSALRALSRQEGATLFTTLLAAFQVLLYRYTGQEDVAVGIPVAGRVRPELEGLIGFFVNTLVLRGDLSAAPSFREYLGRVRSRALAAYAHQDVPFEKLVEELAPKRDLSRNPLFQVSFTKWMPESQVLRLAGFDPAEVVALDTETAKFDLDLTLVEKQGRCRVTVEYAADLFDAATIKRMAGHWRVLLEGIVDDAECRIGELPLLTPEERRQLLVEWNDTAVDFPRDQCIQQLFEQQVERTPESVAVVFGEDQLTYRELNARANRLAHHLGTLGVGPEVLVGICVERSLELVVGLLGILKAGGAYVPLDPGYPAQRLAFMLEDTKAPVLLTQERLLGQLPPHAGRTLCLDRDWPAVAAQPASNPPATASATNLAYVIYTSGSTGTPKGVMVTHANVARLFSATRQWFDFNENDVWTCFHSFAFDFSVWEIWGALIHGSRLVMVPYLVSRDPDAFHALLRHERVTVLNQTPSAFRQLMAADARVNAGSDLVLRLVIFGGEALEMQSLRPWFDRHGDAQPQLVNMYGITETTVHVTYRPIRRADLDTARGSMIGVRIPDLRVHILDRHLQPVPVGVAGELYVGGAGVARGYLNRAELTAERFVADPFTSDTEARLYRSGDLARFTPSGDLEYLGRIDDQVKIRGFRIELGEIEAVLSKHPTVREAVVLLREDVPGDQRLVAYVVPADASLAEIELLRAFLGERLPEYMRPAAYVLLERLPLTPNGKIDRKALPAPDAAAYASRAYEAPVGEIEITLAQIWAEVLKLERVGRHDDFFELGGHSLLVVSMLERMRQAGLHADVRALFVTPTLAELATAVDRDGRIVEVPPNRIPPACDAITPEMLPLVHLTPGDIERIADAVPGGAANIQDIYPLAPLQEGILFHHVMATDGDPYMVSALFGFDSRDRLQRYLQALQAVIDRHDILRTAVLWEGLPEPVQVVWRRAPLAVEEVKLTSAAGDVPQQLRARFDPRHYRVDVRQAPLMRILVAHDAANARWVMLRLSHHLSTDHTTQEIVQREIQAHLLGQADQLPAPLPFRSFVAQARLGVSREEHEAFFRKMLGDVDEPTTPFGLTNVHGDGSGIAEARRCVDASLARRLRERARTLGVSAASVCHLAWAQVLARASGRDDVVFGTVLFGRMQGGSGADRVLGLFINTLPVRLRIGDERVQDSVRHTHVLLGQLLRHEHAPLALAQRCSAVPAPTPLFSALLNYRHSAAAAHVPVDAPQARDGIESLGGEERTNYPLTLSVDDLGEGFALKVQVQSPIEPQRVCAYMHTALEQLVGAMESAPTIALRNLDVLPESERHQVLVDWNDTAVDYPRDQCIQQLFEHQVERTPETVAVVFREEQLTYRELDARANQLAHHLRSLGVGPEVLVGLCVERSLELVVGILGILKAGGAYVPLDPSYPKERLAFVLVDAAVSVVLTQHRLRDTLPPTAAALVCLDAPPPELQQQPIHNPETLTRPDHLAYVIYTSGSTGAPKGVMIEHRSLLNYVLWLQRAFPLAPSDRMLQSTPTSFDISILELFWPLLAGAALEIAPPGAHRSPNELVNLVQRRKITVLQVVPSMLRAIVEGGGLAKLDSLRRLFTAGEALGAELVRRFHAQSAAELVNGYGPTETTVYSTFWRCDPADPRRVVPIGRPLANTRVWILDAHGAPVPIGVAGEVYVAGDGVARGYLGRPDLTAQRFVPDPLAPDAHARMYRTGDRARYLPDGNIEFLGRLDNQIKLRGFRIELGEIEAVLSKHPAVREAVVLLREDVPGDQRLVAYVVARGDAIAAADLRTALKQRLPDYMIPAAFVHLPALPLTPNGKIDRKALPAPEYGNSEVEYRAPRTPMEKAIANIWTEVLNLPQVGVNDNFFDLGGDSLLAIRLLSRIRFDLNIDMSMRRLFETPTVSGLALAAVDNPAAGATDLPLSPRAESDH